MSQNTPYPGVGFYEGYTAGMTKLILILPALVLDDNFTPHLAVWRVQELGEMVDNSFNYCRIIR